MLLTFSVLGLLFLLKFNETKTYTFRWFAYTILSALFFTFSLSVKFVGFYSWCLGAVTICQYIWELLPTKALTNFQIGCQCLIRWCIFIGVSVGVYLTIFYVHLMILNKAGPHDSIMTSAFQVLSNCGNNFRQNLIL